MLETEIKKLRESIEQINTLMVELIQLQSGLIQSAKVNTTQDDAPKVTEVAATAPAPSEVVNPTPPQAAAPSVPVATPPAAAAASTPVATPPKPTAPPGAAALSEWGVYASNLAAQYSAKTGNPANVMAVSQKHGIFDIASATDAQLVPFCDELKSLMGVN